MKSGSEAVIFAEYRLLNALAGDRDYRQDSRIHEDLFVHETAKSIYQALERLDREEIPITKASLYQSANEIDYNVNQQIIEAVYNVDEEPAAVLDDMLVVLENAKRKKAIGEKLQSLLASALKPGPIDIDEAMQGLFEIDQILKSGVSSSLLKDFSDWSNNYIEELRIRATGKRYPYGDEFLDRMILKGAYPGAITTIAAGTGQGKSTYVLNLINALIELHVPCIYVSLEMSGVDTYDRLIALRREIPLEQLYTCDANSVEGLIKVVEEEKEALKTNKNFYFVEEPNLSITRLRSLIKEFKQRSDSNYALVAVDLITQLKDFMHNKSNQSVANSIETAMNDLNALAKELNVHIIGVAQFNRDADNMKVLTADDLDMLRPSLNNIKNSHALAERSRVVLSLFRKKYYSDRYLPADEAAKVEEDILEVNILKNSSGMVGNTLHYLFDGSHFKVLPILDPLPTSTDVELVY